MNAELDIYDIFSEALTLEALDKLPTPRLLAYYKKHRWLDHAGMGEFGEFDEDDDYKKNGIGLSYRNQIKKILDTRRNVE